MQFAGISLEGWAAIATITAASLTMIPRVRVYIKYLWGKIRHPQEEIRKLLEEIQKELKPNGGKSLRDAVELIKREVAKESAFSRTQLNAHPKPLFEIDEHGKLYWANRPFLRLVGFQIFEIKGSGWWNILAPSNRAPIHDKWKQAIEERREIEEEVTLKNTNGEEFRAILKTYAIIGQENFYGYLCELDPV